MEGKIAKALRQCKLRRAMGRAKYGDDAYVEKNMFQEMREELYDLVNYALFQVMKLEEMEKATSLLDPSRTKRRTNDRKVGFEIRSLKPPLKR